MRRYCHNDATVAEHAHREGEQTRREIWEEQKREEIEKRLNNNGSVCIGRGVGYTRVEILIERLFERADLIALNNWLITGSEPDAIEFRESCEAIINKWIDEHFYDILATEYGYVAEDAA